MDFRATQIVSAYHPGEKVQVSVSSTTSWRSLPQLLGSMCGFPKSSKQPYFEDRSLYTPRNCCSTTANSKNQLTWAKFSLPRVFERLCLQTFTIFAERINSVRRLLWRQETVCQIRKGRQRKKNFGIYTFQVCVGLASEGRRNRPGN